MLVKWALLGLSLGLLRVEAGRGRGSPSTTTPAPPPLPGPVDLTLALDRNASSPEQPFTVTKNASAWGEFGWTSTQTSCSSGQAGTHMQAPYHLNEHGWKVDEVPLERLLVAAVLLDVSAEVAANGSFLLTADHLIAWEKKHGGLPDNSVLLINFGTSAHGGARGASRNPSVTTTATPRTTPLNPGLSQGAAVHLTTLGRVVGVGVDLPALDAVGTPRGRGEPAARALMAENVYALLNLDLSRELPAKGFSLLVLPPKVRGAAVAPVRVVATTRSPSPSRAAAAAVLPSTKMAIGTVLCLYLVQRQS
ncbi:isatin hydrolase-like [Thrips palmi]|uniref:Isatin hydrolase-like n=1 Tax=Thrips palmi TaxID=161013 RepID=A0A6P8YPR0_THRPL|nr:isatin hydrolase-like [Thrips palmi]